MKKKTQMALVITVPSLNAPPPIYAIVLFDSHRWTLARTKVIQGFTGPCRPTVAYDRILDEKSSTFQCTVDHEIC